MTVNLYDAKVVKLIRVLALNIVFTLSIILYGASSYATENGGTESPLGAEGVMAGALPPPGLYLINYLEYYSTNRLNDKDGNKEPLDFHVNVTANVDRLVYMDGLKFLGADHGMFILAPLVNIGGTLGGTPAGLLGDTKFGFGDIDIDPFLLAWHGKNWHAAVGVDTYLPVGEYNKTRLFNPGRNYFTIEPVFAWTLLSDQGLELSTKMMYNFNTENHATQYTSGQEFCFDYAAAYHMGQWTMGATGYFYEQVTNDHGGNAAANDGNKGQVFAIGPTLKYANKNMSLELKYQHEMLVENRPQGDNFWAKIIWDF